MLQFSSSISFCMNIRNLFQLESTFECNRIHHISSNKKEVVDHKIFFSKSCNSIILFEDFFNQSRKRVKFEIFASARKLLSKTVQHSKLCAKSFGRSNTNFRTSARVDDLIRFAGNRAVNNIDDPDDLCSFFFCKTQGCKRICSFSGLRDHQKDILPANQGVFVPEF